MIHFYDDEHAHDHYDIHNYDIDGWPGEYIHGPDVYLDDYYMDERWKPVKDFPYPDYWVSDKGRLWSTRTERFIEGTPNIRSGHIDISIMYGKTRYRRLLHRLVAEAFIPNPNNYPMVRHGDDNPNNNCVENLRWGTQLHNVRDCIENGHFRYLTEEDIEIANQKRRTPIKAVHLPSGRKYEFISQREAADALGVNQSDISSVARGEKRSAKGYYFYYANKEPGIDLSNYRYSRHGALIRAIDLDTGDVYVFRGQTEAARELGISISAISMILSGKIQQAKGYTFEYVEETYDEVSEYGNY